MLRPCSDQTPGRGRGRDHHGGEVGAAPQRGYLDWRLPQSDQVHLDAEVFHEKFPGDAAHAVEGVVRVGMGGAFNQTGD